MSELIRNCPLAVRCSQKWEALSRTPARGVRFCGDCKRTVHLCLTHEELAAAVVRNRCVAIPEEGTYPGGRYREAYWVGDPPVGYGDSTE